jgi:nucleotide-binding universal stress UspA family protein
MSSLKSLVVATDFSEHALHAVERAAMVCAAAGATSGVALHVLETAWLDALRRFVSLPAEVEEALIARTAAPLLELVAAVHGRTGFPLEAKVRVGRVLDTILAEMSGQDLLALGMQGSHPLQEFVVGTTAERLLQQARTPVLVVKRRPQAPYERVLVAVDFSPLSQRALSWAAAIAPHAEICIAHVFPVPFEGMMNYAGVSDDTIAKYRGRARREAESAMESLIHAAGVETRSLRRFIAHGDRAVGSLLAKAEHYGADLVVAGRHGKSLTEHLLLGSVTLRLLGECPCDVLVTQ